MTTLVTLTTLDGQQRRAVASPQFDTGTTTASKAPIPCFQCGVCCIKWQPLLSPVEIRQLAAGLGVSVRTARRRYIRPYPLRRGWGMLTTGAVGCVFLRFEAGRSFCSIYAVRPQVCRDWSAGLDKSECREGLELMASGPVLAPADLYPNATDRAELVTRVSALAPSD